MTAVALTATAAPGKWSQTGVALTMTAADAGAGNDFAAEGDILVVAHNTGAGANTVTITSVADPQFGRTGNVAAQSMAAGTYRIFRLTRIGWADAAGRIAITGSNAEVKLGVITGL